MHARGRKLRYRTCSGLARPAATAALPALASQRWPPLRVGQRQQGGRSHRRKADPQVERPDSLRPRSAVADPNLPAGLLQSGRTASHRLSCFASAKLSFVISHTRPLPVIRSAVKSPRRRPVSKYSSHRPTGARLGPFSRAVAHSRRQSSGDVMGCLVLNRSVFSGCCWSPCSAGPGFARAMRRCQPRRRECCVSDLRDAGPPPAHGRAGAKATMAALNRPGSTVA